MCSDKNVIIYVPDADDNNNAKEAIEISVIKVVGARQLLLKRTVMWMFWHVQERPVLKTSGVLDICVHNYDPEKWQCQKWQATVNGTPHKNG